MIPTPLHTRSVSLRLSWGDGESLVVHGRIFDLRKRGIVPLAGKLQGPGVVHDMAVRLQLVYPGLRIRAIEPSMSAFPFAPGPVTRGEGCPDRLPDVQRLVGASLRDGYGSTLTEMVGGPRGCSTSTIMPRCRRWGSLITSAVSNTALHGTPALASACMASHLSRWRVHVAIISTTTSRCLLRSGISV